MGENNPINFQMSEVVEHELRWMSRFSKELYKSLLKEGRLEEYLIDLENRLDRLEEMHMNHLEDYLHERVARGEISYKKMIDILTSEAKTFRSQIAREIRPPMDEEAEDKI